MLFQSPHGIALFCILGVSASCGKKQEVVNKRTSQELTSSSSRDSASPAEGSTTTDGPSNQNEGKPDTGDGAAETVTTSLTRKILCESIPIIEGQEHYLSCRYADTQQGKNATLTNATWKVDSEAVSLVRQTDDKEVHVLFEVKAENKEAMTDLLNGLKITLSADNISAESTASEAISEFTDLK